MNKIFAIALTVATVVSSGAFAETLSIGSANTAPVFANRSGNTAAVETIGNASSAPVYALKSGNGSLVTDVGSASRAPVFAQAGRQNVHIALAR